MVTDAALNAVAENPPSRDEHLSITKSAVSELSRLEFPDPNAPNPLELLSLTAFGIVYATVVLLLSLSAVPTVILLLAGLIVLGSAYTYLKRNTRQMALLSACMLLSRIEREFQLLADFIHTSLSPIERLLDTGKASTVSPLPSEKQRHYFILVQIRSIIGDRIQKIHECLDEPDMRKLEACFDWVRREVTLHQSTLAQSRTIIPLETLEGFTLALLTDLDPESLSEEFLARNEA